MPATEEVPAIPRQENVHAQHLTWEKLVRAPIALVTAWNVVAAIRKQENATADQHTLGMRVNFRYATQTVGRVENATATQANAFVKMVTLEIGVASRRVALWSEGIQRGRCML